MQEKRQQISNIIGLNTSTARTRKCVDKFGLNIKIQESIDRLESDLLEIKKAGGPAFPAKLMKAPSKLATDVEKADYNVAKAEWDSDMELWKSYTSSDYLSLVNQYSCYKKLHKLSQLLRKPSQSDRIKQEIVEIQTILADKPALRKPNELQKNL